jgi:cytochrome P450
LKKSAENDGRRFIEPSKAAQKILMEKDLGTPLNTVSQSNGREHVAYRAIVDRRFRGANIRKLEDYVTATAKGLIERIGERTDCEAVESFCVPLPVFVIADLLGVPKAEYQTIKRWSDAVLTYTAMIVPEDVAIAGAESMVEMHRYMLDRIRERRSNPQDDVLTVLAEARFDGERPLTDREILSYIDEILVAGNETTTNTISAGLLYLAQDTALQATLRSQPALIPKFVEEILRISTPLQVALRLAVEDVNIGGIDIPKGSRILVGIGSCNRDDDSFPTAERIDLERRNAGTHLTFGGGEHHCLGADLARLELRVAFRLWLAEFSRIELAQHGSSVQYPSSFALRGPLSLKLRLHRAD